MCGASEKPMMMSGPAPEFEVTAVCWLMSSQPTKSTLTSTPVSLVNLAALARNTSSSACTKRTGRSMRKDAPFSIAANLGAATSAALMADGVWAEAPVAASAAAETPRANASRRVMSSSLILSLFSCSRRSPPVNSALDSSGTEGFTTVFLRLAGADRSPLRPKTLLMPSLAVRTAIHADRLPATERGVLQHRRIDAAYRPHARQDQ